MDTRQWETLNQRLDRIERSLASVDVTLAVQHNTLVEHMRRSVANEDNIEVLRAEVKPISTHVAVMGALGKSIGLVAAIVAICVGVARLLGH